VLAKAVGGGPNGGGAPACGIDLATKRECPDAPGWLTSSRYLGPGSPLPRLWECILPTAAGRGGRPNSGASLPVNESGPGRFATTSLATLGTSRVAGACRRVPVWEIAPYYALPRSRPFLPSTFLKREIVMTPRKGKRFRTSERSEPAASFTLQHGHAAGVDVHSDNHFVAVPPDNVPAGFVNPDAQLPPAVRKFGANTGDLEALAAWLKDCHVTRVAMRRSRRRCTATGARSICWR
jgi:hypothetical protein